MLVRKYALAAGFALALWALWLLWLWQPDRQVRLHTTHFLKKVERRNWDAARAFMAEDFSDRWGHNKTTALEDGRQVFAQFLFLTIENQIVNCEVQDGTEVAHTVLKIKGQGGAVAPFVMQAVNDLHEPFVFTWRRMGAAPWNWQLVRIDQSELKIDEERAF